MDPAGEAHPLMTAELEALKKSCQKHIDNETYIAAKKLVFDRLKEMETSEVLVLIDLYRSIFVPQNGFRFVLPEQVLQNMVSDIKRGCNETELALFLLHEIKKSFDMSNWDATCFNHLLEIELEALYSRDYNISVIGDVIGKLKNEAYMTPVSLYYQSLYYAEIGAHDVALEKLDKGITRTRLPDDEALLNFLKERKSTLEKALADEKAEALIAEEEEEKRKSTPIQAVKAKKQKQKQKKKKQKQKQLEELLGTVASSHDDLPDTFVSKSQQATLTEEVHINGFIKFDGVKHHLNCATGVMKIARAVLPRSLVEVNGLQLGKLEQLSNLCSCHPSLLTVHCDLEDCLVTDPVNTVQYFFTEKYEKLVPISPEEWFNKIEEELWTIFRDIVRGLMYLFHIGQSCGELKFNLYVTKDGRGRILPSFATSSPGEDLKQVADVIRTIISLPGEVEIQDCSFLPHSLKNFFYHIDRIDNLLEKMVNPVSLADHVHFWSIGEKIEFAGKCRRLSKEAFMRRIINKKLVSLKLLDGWWLETRDIYRDLWHYSVSSLREPYEERVDIIAYYAAVYFHIRESRYETALGNRKPSDEDIEKDLTSLFPTYYTDMFQCLCDVAADGHLTDSQFMMVSTVYSLVSYDMRLMGGTTSLLALD